MQRESRERRILAGSGVVLFLVIAYLVLWKPVFKGQCHTEKALLQTCTQLAEMETLGRGARGLSVIAAAPVPCGAELEQAFNTSLTNHGPKVTRMAMSGESVQVQLDKVPSGAIAKWLQEARQAQCMKVIDANIKYVDAAALVNVTAALQGLAAPGC